MTTDIERQFFDTFGIEPLYLVPKPASPEWSKDYEKPTYKDLSETTTPIYPEITAEMYLELILVETRHWCKKYPYDNDGCFRNFMTDMKDFKRCILSSLIDIYHISHNYEIKHQVQVLFEVSNNDR